MSDARPTPTKRAPGVPGPAGPDSPVIRLYAEVRTRPHGAIITSEEGMSLAGVVTARQFQRAMRSVNRKLWKDDQRVLVAVANVGYRIVAPHEHVEVAVHKEKAAHRRLKEAFRVLLATCRPALTPEQAAAVDRAQRHVGRKLALVRLADKHGDALPDAPRIRRLLPGDLVRPKSTEPI